LIGSLLQVALLAFLPISEIRGALPYGVLVCGLPFWPVVLVGFVCNILPYFAVTWGSNWILKLLCRFPWVNRVWNRLVVNAQRRFRPYSRWGKWGLIAFVGIPLPFTGVWTGSLVAFLAGLKMRESAPFVFTGLVIASMIVSMVVLFGQSL